MRRAGLRPFVPVEEKFIQRNRYRRQVRVRVRRAMLLGMVFLQIAEPVNWLRLCRTPMVVGPWGWAGFPTASAPLKSRSSSRSRATSASQSPSGRCRRTAATVLASKRWF